MGESTVTSFVQLTFRTQDKIKEIYVESSGGRSVRPAIEPPSPPRRQPQFSMIEAIHAASQLVWHLERCPDGLDDPMLIGALTRVVSLATSVLDPLLSPNWELLAVAIRCNI